MEKWIKKIKKLNNSIINDKINYENEHSHNPNCAIIYHNNNYHTIRL